MKTKKTLQRILLFILLLSTTELNAQTLNQGLVGWWPFTGNAVDSVKMLNNGTVYGAVLTSDRFGNSNSAYYFDGNGDYIDVGTHSSLRSSTVSVNFWFRYTDASKTFFFVGCQNANNGDWGVACLYNTTNGLQTSYSSGTNNHLTGYASKIKLNDDKWHMFTSTYDKNGNKMCMYIDGCLIGNVNYSGSSGGFSGKDSVVFNSGEHWMFGAHSQYFSSSVNNGPRYYKGYLDDVRIYNRAITAKEVFNLYNNTELDVDLGKDTTICLGDTIELSVSDVYKSYQWAPTYRLIGGSTNSVKVFPKVDVDYLVKVGVTGNCYIQDTISIKVKKCCDLTSDFAIVDNTLCLGDSATVVNYSTYKAKNQYNWKFTGAQNPTTYSGYNPPKIAYSKAGKYQVELIIIDSCRNDTVTKELNVVSLQIDAGSDKSACKMDTVQIGIAHTNGYRYTWTPNTNIINPTVSNPNVVFKQKITYLLSVYDSSSGCKSNDSLVLTEQFPKAIDVGKDSVICSGDTILLTVSNSFTSYKWSPTYRMIGVDKNQVAVFPSKDTSYVVIADNDGKCPVSDTIKIKVKNCCATKADFSIVKDKICSGDSAFVFNNSTNRPKTLYQWDFEGAKNPVFQGYSPPKKQYLQPGKHTIQLIMNDSCGSDTISKNITVIDFQIDAGKDTIGCSMDTVRIGPVAKKGYRYNWGPTSNLSDPNIPNPLVYLNQNITYQLTVFDSTSQCQAIDSVVISSIPRPFINIDDATLCKGDSLTIDLSAYGYVYEWHNGFKGAKYTIRGDTMLWVTAANNYCSFTDSAKMVYISPPNPNWITDTVLCMSHSLTLGTSQPNLKFRWLPNGETSAEINIKNGGWYFLEVSNECGQTLDSAFILEQDCECNAFIPNVFTPNSDQLNDSFGPLVSCNVSDYHLLIYNRWGEKLFESDYYLEQWDGKYRGTLVAEGVYFWILQYKNVSFNLNKKEHLSGTVTLLR